MFPILFHVQSFAIHGYGIFIAIGFLLSLFLARKDAIREGLPSEKYVDLCFWSVFIGLFGARLLFVITRWDDYFSIHPVDAFQVWEGGLVFFGVPLFCVPFFLWYSKRARLPALKTLDISIRVLPLAHAFGRLGCLSAGCCYGRPTEMPWGIKLYVDGMDSSLVGVPLHPTQVYEGLGLLIIFAILTLAYKRKKFDGQILALYGMLYPILRFATEHFRGDEIRGFVFGGTLSTSQFIGTCFFFLSLAGYFWMRKRSSKALASNERGRTL